MKSRLFVIFSLVISFVFGLSMSAVAAPVQCTHGAFTWECTNGSEQYATAPLPPVSGMGGYGYFEPQMDSDAGFGGNADVQVGSAFALRFKTAQKYLGWWGANGELHVAEQINGVITLPNGAVMIAIPGDVLGDFDLVGWVKGQHTDTGEYVLASTAWLK